MNSIERTSPNAEKEDGIRKMIANLFSVLGFSNDSKTGQVIDKDEVITSDSEAESEVVEESFDRANFSPEFAEAIGKSNPEDLSGKFIDIGNLERLNNDEIEFFKKVPILQLEANKLMEIPEDLINLQWLSAGSITKISENFVNLEHLYTNSLLQIPNTFLNLRILRAHNIKELPKELINIEILYADNLEVLPLELKNLRMVKTKALFNISDYEKLRETYDYNENEWEKTNSSD